MRVLALVLYMLHWLPIVPGPTWEAELHYRWMLATAIVAVTDVAEEQFILARIPRFESNYRVDVGVCAVLGPQKEKTAWQILPRSKAESYALCQTFEGDAEIARDRVRESLRACSKEPWSNRLSLYARGDCSSLEGRRLSTHRMPSERSIADFKSIVSREGKEP